MEPACEQSQRDAAFSSATDATIAARGVTQRGRGRRASRPAGSTLRVDAANLRPLLQPCPAPAQPFVHDLPEGPPSRAFPRVNTHRLTLIIAVPGTLLSAICAGPVAALLVAAYLLGVLTTELTRRGQ